MKRNTLILYSIPVILLLVYIILEAGRPKPFDWNPGYSKNSREPMGCSVLYQFLPDLFPGYTIESSTHDFYTFCRADMESNRNMIVIVNEFQLDREASRALINWVEQGNNLFVSSLGFSNAFCREAGFMREEYINPLISSKPNGKQKSYYRQTDTGDTTMVTGPWLPTGFSADSVSWADVLMESFVEGASGPPVNCMIKIVHGRGNIYIHGAPFLFSNYMLHSDKTLALAAYTLSYLPPANTIWDEYYKTESAGSSGNGMKVIFERASLRYAWMLLIATMVLYVLFMGKRRQRAIPVIPPPRNETAGFVGTLSQLYFEKRNNSDIILKRYKYLFSVLRNKFSIMLVPGDAGFHEKLRQATGASHEEVKQLSEGFIAASKGPISAQMAVKASHFIDQFYEKYVHQIWKTNNP